MLFIFRIIFVITTTLWFIESRIIYTYCTRIVKQDLHNEYAANHLRGFPIVKIVLCEVTCT